ncbi:MAG: hypothetical protein OEZ33_10930 [Gammaproteobacteria bacterium]|nr:hypothetical protein [Gammaproteobacteria bacterium]MDH5778716.1 hypothetical protein [Gammaproteobacteria bacterium]
MHIPLPKYGFLDKEKAEQDLEKLIQQPSARELRPCPNCKLPCDSLLPADCATQCDSKCVNAPGALSSEPEAHPIELKVVPIVFELSALRLLQPCWSCEGHVNGQGELWKLPQISFYTASEIYPKLLAGYLTRLRNQSILNYPWQVVMVDYGQTWGPTYQLEPALNHIEGETKLDLLQMDLQTIANDLAEKLKQEARLMLVEVRRAS